MDAGRGVVAAVSAIANNDTPTGHRGGPPLYGRMMNSIRRGHGIGNSIRLVKLPLVFLEQRLYAEAIAQFWALSRALETQLEVHKAHPMVARVRELGLCVTPGYAADLRQLLGEDWDAAANEVLLTAATRDYVAALQEADPVSLTAAAFILYGALVVGGGKSTQAKVAKIFPRCDHKTFDVAPDMVAARAAFKRTFTEIGKEWPSHFETLERQAAEWMGRNNRVLLSIRCVGVKAAAAAAAAAAVAVVSVIGARALLR